MCEFTTTATKKKQSNLRSLGKYSKMSVTHIGHHLFYSLLYCSRYLSLHPCLSFQVWFQNRRSKERRMKQLSALGARRHAFFRGPRRMRPLGSRLDEPDLLGPGGYGYYGGMREKRTSVYSFSLPRLFTQPIVLHTQDKSIFFRQRSNHRPFASP